MELIPLDKKMDAFIVPWLGKTMKLVDVLVNLVFRQHNMELKKNQVIILRLISNGMHAQSDLSIVTERDKSSLSRLLKGMISKGLVKRQKDEIDARQFQVYLTKKGEETLEQALPILVEAFDKIQDRVSQEDLETVKRVMGHFQNNISKELTLFDNK
ncbi:MAG: winged helix DNA-binding protein [Flavobacteriales bacterium]|jgi:DNA-binding MarR family transcriptional regulator|tara:strand:+ start:1240 stop:1710 length:471 start_codon:yes stop_codon:yes gene_type:complete